MENWRSTIGRFAGIAAALSTRGRVKAKTYQANKFPTNLHFSLVLGLLLLIAGIEPNPGPYTTASKGSAENLPPILNTVATPTTLISNPSTSSINQEGIFASKLQTIIERMASMETKLENKLDIYTQKMEKRIQAIEDKSKDHEDRIEEQESRLAMANVEITSLETEIIQLKANQKKQQRRIIDAENRSRRDNLIFHNIDQRSGDRRLNYPDIVSNFLFHTLKLPAYPIIRAHSLPKNKKGYCPIIVKFQYSADTKIILQANKQLKQTNMFITEDFAPETWEKRRKLNEI